MEARSDTPINLTGQDLEMASSGHQPAQNAKKGLELGAAVRLRLDDGGVGVRGRRWDILKLVWDGEARGSHAVDAGENGGTRIRSVSRQQESGKADWRPIAGRMRGGVAAGRGTRVGNSAKRRPATRYQESSRWREIA